MDKRATNAFPMSFQIQNWQDVTFENSWANVGSPYHDAQYYKDPFNIVRLRGRIDTGTSGTVAFTLPESFRPIATEEHPASDGTNIANVSIASNGQVTPTDTSGTPSVSLDGITFKAEQ